MKYSLVVLLALLLTSCASTPTEERSPIYEAAIIDEHPTLDEAMVAAQQAAIEKIKQARRENSLPEKPSTQEPSPEFKYVMNTQDDHPKVKKWIKYYSVKDRKRFQRFLNRGAKYKTLIQDLLVTNGLPPDLYYLGILESGFVTKAISHAGAVGPWQFMAPTGREYGLKINNYVDERVDTVRATLAAIKYLKELYRQKKSWHMALAAYNAGPGRVRRAMRRGGSRNYWNLTRRRLLPRDTREYIPQFLAILTIGKNPERFGFTQKASEELPPMELVKVPSPVSLKNIAKVTGYPLKKLRKLNIHLTKGMTPPTKKRHYHIWVEKTYSQKVDRSYKSLASYRIKGLKVRRVASRRIRIHRVRRGQNLSSIARRYGTSVSRLKKLNRLRSHRIYVGQRLRVRGSRRVASTSRKVQYHRVRSGQTLGKLARRYGMSVSSLKKLNGMRSNKLLVGQRLKVYKAKGSPVNRATYRVRRGDNLTAIARKTGTTVARIKKLNNLKGGKIYPGQKLRLIKTAKKSSVRRYKIRRGDNLYKIAKKFGTTIKKLKSLNKLRSNRIQRGQVLLVAAN